MILPARAGYSRPLIHKVIHSNIHRSIHRSVHGPLAKVRAMDGPDNSAWSLPRPAVQQSREGVALPLAEALKPGGSNHVTSSVVPTASDWVVWPLRRSVLSHRAMSDFENTRFRDHQGSAAVSAFCLQAACRPWDRLVVPCCPDGRPGHDELRRASCISGS